jgi:hypothetical protein
MGLGRRTFAPGEVLTASNVMNYLQDQAVMNFAGTAARGSAIGTAVSEGMVSYMNDTDNLEVYRAIGTAAPAWNPVAFRSEVEAVPPAGLVRIVPPTVNFSGGTATANTNGEITFTAATSISLNNVFSSTYRNYRIVVTTHAMSANTNISIRFRNAGTDNSSNLYYQYWTIKRISGVIQDNSGGPSTSYALYGKATANTYGAWTGDIISPASSSQVTTVNGIGHGGDTTNSYNVFNTVLFDATTAFDGLTLLPSSGNMTGAVSIYGYRT